MIHVPLNDPMLLVTSTNRIFADYLCLIFSFFSSEILTPQAW